MNKIVFYLAIGYIGWAAYIGHAIAAEPLPDMNEQTLQNKYHVAATEGGLIGALRHPEVVVRQFAATKLANDGYKTAIRPILDALASEKVENVKLALATAASRLGAPEGVSALQSMCEDRSWSPSMRMAAAQSMVFGLGRQECLSDVVDVLRSEPGDHEAVPTALNLLSRFKQIPSSQLEEVRGLVALYLQSPSPDFRLAAGTCIRDMGTPWAISQLQAALNAERDEAVRNSLAKDLLSVRP